MGVIEVNPLEELATEDPIKLPENGTSLDLLQAIYRSMTLPLATRMRAAGMALPHEHPKLGVSVNVAWSDEMAVRLEQAIARSSQVLRTDHPTKVIEHQPSEPQPPSPEQSPLSAVIGPVPDRRFRRA
jgi:hypothetical protein